MSDLETMKVMLTRAGIEFEIRDAGEGKAGLTVNEGYVGFFTDMVFTAEGALSEMGAWE